MCGANAERGACVIYALRMRLRGANQQAAPVWRHLWWMIHPQSLCWGRKVSQKILPRPSLITPGIDCVRWVLILQPCQPYFPDSSFLFDQYFFIPELFSHRFIPVNLPTFLFFTSLILCMNTSSTHVPAHLLYTSTREASGPPEETLYWEGNTHQCPTVPAALQTELQVSGESEHHKSAMWNECYIFNTIRWKKNSIMYENSKNSKSW